MEATRTRLSVVLVGILLASSWAVAQKVSVSVLSRLQTIDDPELGGLIRVAIDNRRSLYAPEPEVELKIIRDVTESYARIKLLDRQIEETRRRLGGAAAPVRDEMILAMAELEAKLTMELASLRQTMGIVPTHAFGRRAEDQLRGWYVLDVVDPNLVLVHTSSRLGGDRFIDAMTSARSLDYIAQRLDDANNLPIRVDITQAARTIELADEMQGRILRMMERAGLQMQGEVHLETTYRRPSSIYFVALNGEVGNTLRTGDGLPVLNNTLDPNEAIDRVEGLTSLSSRLPATVELIAYEGDEALRDSLAARVVETLRRLGIADFVDVRLTDRPKDPRWEYIGTWEGQVDGQRVGVRLERDMRAIYSSEDSLGRYHQRYSGGWSFQDNWVILNEAAAPVLGASGSGNWAGVIDESGNLVVDLGEIKITLTKRPE